MTIQYVTMMFLVYSLVFSGAFTADAMRTGSAPESVRDRNGLIMASTSEGGTACNAPVPVLFDAVPGDGQISISWSDEHTGNSAVTGYNIYSVRDGKSQPLTSIWPRAAYTITGLTNGQEYCYKVTSLHADCESRFSNSVCGVPAAQVPQK